jgi:hypothetical protein
MKRMKYFQNTIEHMIYWFFVVAGELVVTNITRWIMCQQLFRVLPVCFES